MAGSERWDGFVDVCEAFGDPAAFEVDVAAAAGFSSEPGVSVFGLTVSAAGCCGALAWVSFADDFGLSAPPTLPVAAPVSGIVAAVFFTAFGVRSMVVGFGVSWAALPVGFVAVELAFALGDAVSDGLAPVGVALDVSAGLPVDGVAALDARDRLEPVDLDLEVGRCGDFTILVSLFAHSLAGMTNRSSRPDSYIR